MEAGGILFVQQGRSVKLGKLRREFRFGEETLIYTLSDKTGERVSYIPYESIDLKKKQILVIRNDQHRFRCM